MYKRIVIFEAEGGSDKCINGHRRDTRPILNAIKEKDWDSEVVYYRDEWNDLIFDYVSNKFDGYISRINPGNLPNGEKVYFETLRRLSDVGLVGMPHQDVMTQFGAKDALVKLSTTNLVPRDTYHIMTSKALEIRFQKVFLMMFVY